MGGYTMTGVRNNFLGNSVVTAQKGPEYLILNHIHPMEHSLVYHSGFNPPILHVRAVGAEAWQILPMQAIGKGRQSDERCWRVHFPAPLGLLEFFIVDGSRPVRRDPAQGVYHTRLQFSVLQDGQLYPYWPANRVDPARRDYEPGKPPVLKSKFLAENRPYRVVLPRGYEQHPERRYPVLYLKDGQNVFDPGPFGTWDAAVRVRDLTARGDVREMILVGVDNTPSRLADYVAPDDGGKADRYARFLIDELKPLIDAKYRTLADPWHTGVLGSSAGGVAALYLGWEHPEVFRRVGAMSGSWWLRRFPTRIRREPPRNLRLYLDSGDQGGRWRDGFTATRELQESLRRKGMGIYYTVGEGHHHNEAAWGQRLPLALRYLYPACEEEPDAKATAC